MGGGGELVGAALQVAGGRAVEHGGAVDGEELGPVEADERHLLRGRREARLLEFGEERRDVTFVVPAQLGLAGVVAAGAVAAGAVVVVALASALHCVARKSLHFWPFKVPAVLAAWYLALHSFMVSAEAEEARPIEPTTVRDARDINRMARLVIGISSAL